ncbi:hypothetical protein GIB67_015852 [Kingdonia uniflora]|uniref:Pyruvate dehydrogenase E1 component subunit beta n=1 Tax=Kingdonia uniflora TaxID=39325 RepID=A0A7J7NE64_9MAGN|nr:hypothetical protein GIB67_015852 [Kingdonia uniflora]
MESQPTDDNFIISEETNEVDNTLMEYCLEEEHVCYASWYTYVPGLKVLAPYLSEDSRGLLKAAIRDPDPVVFLENELLLVAAEILSKEGISIETIRPLDRVAINASVRKTNRLVTLEESFPQHGVGAEIWASVVVESFAYLDAPVDRIAGAEVPIPFAATLERIVVPQLLASASATWIEAKESSPSTF